MLHFIDWFSLTVALLRNGRVLLMAMMVTTGS